jgi:hypothetical protein
MKCNFCDSEAVVNYQKTWIRFDIKKNEEYILDLKFNGIDIGEISINENFHLCKKHEKMWIEDEIP